MHALMHTHAHPRTHTCTHIPIPTHACTPHASTTHAYTTHACTYTHLHVYAQSYHSVTKLSFGLIIMSCMLNLDICLIKLNFYNSYSCWYEAITNELPKINNLAKCF